MQETDVRKLIRALDPMRCAWHVAWRFSLLVASLWVATRGPGVLAPVAFLLIAVMQYHILVLSHEAQHLLISSDRKRNDRIGAWLLAYPFGQTFFSERSRHLAHHQLVGQPSDPDYYRYVLDDKRPYAQMIGYFIRLATYGKVMEYLASALRERSAGDTEPPADRRSGRELITVACFQLTLLGLFSLWSSPLHYFLFWLFPLLLVSSPLSEFREFCEHAVAPRTPNVLKTFRLPRWQAFLLGPVGFQYHAEHHFHPAIPHYLLKQVSELYPETDDRCEVHASYFSVLPLLRDEANFEGSEAAEP